LGMNFLNQFSVNINSQKGQLVLERKSRSGGNVMNGSRHSAVMVDENRKIIKELENKREQIKFALQSRQTLIEQLKEDIRTAEQKKIQCESIISGAHDRGRFERTRMTRDDGKQTKIKKYEAKIEKFERHIKMRKNEIAVNQKQIVELKQKDAYCIKKINAMY